MNGGHNTVLVYWSTMFKAEKRPCNRHLPMEAYHYMRETYPMKLRRKTSQSEQARITNTQARAHTHIQRA